jgi:hypothetical protein
VRHGVILEVGIVNQLADRSTGARQLLKNF